MKGKTRYPPASAWRNPYIKKRWPRSKQDRASGYFTERGEITKNKVIELTRSGKYTTHTEVAAEAGISRERVRQILNHFPEFDNFGKRMGFRLEWPCPDCGVLISLRPGKLRTIVHQPAVCRPCAKDYCQKGLHRFSEVGYGPNNGCKVCYGKYANETVEVRTCQYCLEPLEISHKMRNLMKTPSMRGKYKGKYHRKCYYKSLIKTHCIHGHEFTPKNSYYDLQGHRSCRACIKQRGRERYLRKKAEKERQIHDSVDSLLVD